MKTVTCEIPLTGLPDDVAKRVVGCEWRHPKEGEIYFDFTATRWRDADCTLVFKRPTLILRPELWEGFKVLTGAAAIAQRKVGEWSVFTVPPLGGFSDWVVDNDCDWWQLEGDSTKAFESILGVKFPPSTGDWRRDIWLNPDHPAYRGEA